MLERSDRQDVMDWSSSLEWTDDEASLLIGSSSSVRLVDTLRNGLLVCWWCWSAAAIVAKMSGAGAVVGMKIFPGRGFGRPNRDRPAAAADWSNLNPSLRRLVRRCSPVSGCDRFIGAFCFFCFRNTKQWNCEDRMVYTAGSRYVRLRCRLESLSFVCWLRVSLCMCWDVLFVRGFICCDIHLLWDKTWVVRVDRSLWS